MSTLQFQKNGIDLQVKVEHKITVADNFNKYLTLVIDLSHVYVNQSN